MKIGVDLDGVLYDFIDSHRTYLAGGGKPLEDMPKNRTWNYWDEWGMTEKEWLTSVNDGVDFGTIFVHGKPAYGSLEVLARLRRKGHTIHIITNRQYGSHSISNTEFWLRNWKVPYDSLTFSADKTVVWTDVMIDDYVSNLLLLSSAGTDAVAFDQPWNGIWWGPSVSTWKEFERYVDLKEAETCSKVRV